MVLLLFVPAVVFYFLKPVMLVSLTFGQKMELRLQVLPLPTIRLELLECMLSSLQMDLDVQQQRFVLQNATSGSIKITIMDLAGNQLYAQTHDLKNSEEEIKIDTEFLKSGTYVLRVVTAQESITQKLIRY